MVLLSLVWFRKSDRKFGEWAVRSESLISPNEGFCVSFISTVSMISFSKRLIYQNDIDFNSTI